VPEEIKHLATKEDLHREISIQTRWLITILVGLQVPTWIGMIQLWSFLANIAGKISAQ
jgi:hypothetical protein